MFLQAFINSKLVRLVHLHEFRLKFNNKIKFSTNSKERYIESANSQRSLQLTDGGNDGDAVEQRADIGPLSGLRFKFTVPALFNVTMNDLGIVSQLQVNLIRPVEFV
jgi:hypothetical protein